MQREVTDNEAAGRYEMAVGDAVAFLSYAERGGRRVLLHTEVPDALSGQGVGSALVRGALDRLRAAGRQVESRCEFVTAFVARHPEYRDVVPAAP